MALVCFIGRHGAGKTTFGQALASNGVKHVSVGLLRRLARAGEYPADIPVSLMLAMKRAPAGGPLPMETSVKLINFVATFENCILDGFPSTVAHLDILPPSARIALLWSPAQLRTTRLESRAATTLRQWTPGRESAREQNLAAVIMAARKRRQVVFIPNRGHPPTEAARTIFSNLFPTCAST